MAKSEPITYQSVARFCNEIAGTGNNPSVRKLHAQLGGSFSTLSEHLQQWRSQQNLASATDAELSDELRQALLAEFSRVTDSIKVKLNKALFEKEEQLTETRELLAEYENKLAAIEKSLKDCKEASRLEQLSLEKRLSAAESGAHSAALREKALQDKLDAMIEKCHQAELRAAVAETQVAEHQKRASEGS
jgi:hypothetical protein